MEKKNDWPVFRSSFLNDIASAFKRRSKALSKQVGSFHVEKSEYTDSENISEDFVLTVDSNVYFEPRIELIVSTPRHYAFYVLSERKNKYSFKFKIDGSIAYRPPSDIVVCLEDSILEIWAHLNGRKDHRLEEIWKRLEIDGSTIEGNYQRREDWG